MFTAVPFRLSLKCCTRLTEKRMQFVFSLLLLLSVKTWSQCTTPTATIARHNTSPSIAITSFTSPTEKLWPGTLNLIPPTNEGAPVTLGVKFRSSVSGLVKGIRFFSSDDAILAPGSYTGQLWSSDGTLLASGTFSNVTSNDWQELVFAAAVLISANTTYVASYHTNGTKYVGTTGGLISSFTNGSLTALDNLSSGGNGVFAYGSAASFPGNSIGANYWVDVMFSPNENQAGELAAVKKLTVQ